jgi:hypothetical protein
MKTADMDALTISDRFKRIQPGPKRRIREAILFAAAVSSTASPLQFNLRTAVPGQMFELLFALGVRQNNYFRSL